MFKHLLKTAVVAIGLKIGLPTITHCSYEQEYNRDWLTGREFNEKYQGPFYKVINPKGHFGFIYKIGENIDTLPFNPSREKCSDGGLYFTTSENISNFHVFGTTVGTIKIPDDARVMDYGEKFKAALYFCRKMYNRLKEIRTYNIVIVVITVTL